MAGERSEKATPKRKQDERKKGNVFQSQDLVAVASLFASFYGLKFLGPFMLEQMEGSINTFFGMANTYKVLSQANVMRIALEGVKIIMFCSMPLLLIGIATAAIMTLAQTKGLVTGSAIKFKMSNLSIGKGFKRMFSSRGIVELLKASIKASVILYLVYKRFAKFLPRFAALMDMDAAAAISLVGEFIISLVNTAGAIFLVLAGADYAYQWWQYEKNLRMSKQEIKEEYKHTEGDPQVKGQIRQRQRKMAMGRMMQNVPKADVVIRNPTHFAIAIAYDAEKNRAPIVLAKGADYVAQRIVKIAEENNITTIENRPLARGLFDAVDVDREIPEQFYNPVAEVLAFVYSLKQKKH
ncbi:MAG: flagellar biosynthesis protein FlhB [Oscillospiraceae bacterium]